MFGEGKESFFWCLAVTNGYQRLLTVTNGLPGEVRNSTSFVKSTTEVRKFEVRNKSETRRPKTESSEDRIRGVKETILIFIVFKRMIAQGYDRECHIGKSTDKRRGSVQI